ncbi:hypothetical protein SESBI_18370 [Sesbania bispinosa]|nr:hypothetical protein SESBI_18370 [Sesbania bispinosa]
MEGEEGIGEDGTVRGREGGDEGGDERVVEGGPRDGGDFTPKMVFGAEAAEAKVRLDLRGTTCNAPSLSTSHTC